METGINDTKQIRLFDHFKANDIMPDAEPEEKQEACVEFATLFALERGIREEDAEKLRTALVGSVQPDGSTKAGSLGLINWELYMADVSAILRVRDSIWTPFGGHLSVPDRNNTSYDIRLRPHTKDDPQRMLGVAIQKRGSAHFDENGKLIEQPFFWTYAGVILQTGARADGSGNSMPGMPLTLAADVRARASADGKGKVLTLRWSSRMYLHEDEETGDTINRLDTLTRGNNNEQRFLEAIIHAGFPVHTARLSRMDSQNRTGGWTPSRARQTRPVSLVGAGTQSAPPQIDGDPFAPK